MNVPETKQPNRDRFLSVSLALSKITPTPEFKEQNGKPYILCGADNQWPQQLLELFRTASDHRAIIQGKARYIAGKNVEFPQGTTPPAILQQANSNEKFHDIFIKSAKDWEIFRGFYIRVRFNRLGEPARIWHVPYHKVRTNRSATKYYICEAWGDKKAEKEIEELDSLETSDKIKDAIFSWLDYDPAGNAYSTPEYIAAVPYLSIDKETANFHENNVSSGFTAGTMLTMFRGEPDDNEKREIDQKIKAKTTGSKQAGEVLVYWADEDEKKPEIDALRSNDLDKQYLQLADLVQQKTFTAHNITSGMLFGIKSPGQLGGRQEILEAWELLDANYIQPQQETLIQAYITLCQICGIQTEFSITRLQPIMRDILELMDKGLVDTGYVQEQLGIPVDKTQKPSSAESMIKAINSLSPLVANKVLESLTEDEIRSMAGLPPKPKETSTDPLAAATKMSADTGMWNDETDLVIFAQFGELESEYEILDEASVRLAATLEQDAQKVLLAISEAKYNSLQEIATVTNLDIETVTSYVEELIAKKLVTPSPSTGGGMTITPTGQLEIDQRDPGTVLIQTKFKYNGPKDDKNRPFCAKLMELGRVYTKDDIDALSTKLGYDVWKRRGGWYRVPGSEPALNIPHCRHSWQQIIVRRRTN
jgi:DNA-binding MarR family transcriptional regulator